MFNKLRANYNLSNVLVRIFFVLAVVLSTWQVSLGTMYHSYFGAVGDVVNQLSGANKLVIALISSTIMGVVLMFVTPLIAGLFLNVARIYSVPRAEYCLLVNLYCAAAFFINGLLNLINLITPIFIVWGSVLFPIIITVGCFVSFYAVTAKMYFNDVTRVHYFKCLLVVFVIVMVLEVL